MKNETLNQMLNINYLI
ncbi:Protein of unknown function [Escherichia coli D6-113.11]|nr:Protein of unknown function [Escherichia coli D6-113.11]CDU34360.1 Protein of unknown function [Escherichia coli D6-113.11]